MPKGSADQTGGYPRPVGDDWSHVVSPRGRRMDSRGADPDRRRLLKFMLGGAGILAFTDLINAFQALTALGSLRTERPATTQVMPEVTVNLKDLNLRNDPTIPLEQDNNNTINVDQIDAVGRVRNGNGQTLHSFTSDHPTVTLANVPVVYGYNPDEPASRNTGLWAAIPVELKVAILWPQIGITHKKGWAYFSISHQTDGAVSIPNNEFAPVKMSPDNHDAAVVIAEK